MKGTGENAEGEGEARCVTKKELERRKAQLEIPAAKVGSLVVEFGGVTSVLGGGEGRRNETE